MTSFKKTLSRRVLSSEEADNRIQNSFQQISALTDCIFYWKSKIGKELTAIDRLILWTDKLTSPEEFILHASKKIEAIQWKIYNDYGRFCMVKNKLF